MIQLQSNQNGLKAQQAATMAEEEKAIYDSKIFNYDMICDLIDEVEIELSASISQITLIENNLVALRKRYQRALDNGKRSFAYSLRLKIATVEGVKGMYTEYISRKQTKLERLQNYTL